MTAVLGLGWTSPGFPDWRAWAAGEAGSSPYPREVLPVAHRRRATLLARLAADVLDQALGPAGWSDLPIVFGSVGGELDQTFQNLDLLLQTPPSSSPLRFGNSVHNAALGQLSIPAANTRFASAIAASPDSVVAMVLLEALAWQAAHGGRVAAVWAEEPWPGLDFPPLAAAVVLGDGPAPLGTLSGPRRTGLAAPVDPRLHDQPCAHAGSLLRALAVGPDLAEPKGARSGAASAPASIALGDGWEIQWTPS